MAAARPGGRPRGGRRAARAHPGDRAQAKVPRAKPRTWRGAALAEELPVARVVVDRALAAPRPALRLPRARRAGRRRAAGRAGPGALRGRAPGADGRREGALSTGSSSSGSPSPTTPGRWPPSPRSSRPSRCCARSCSRLARAVADRYAGQPRRRAAAGGAAAARARRGSSRSPAAAAAARRRREPGGLGGGTARARRSCGRWPPAAPRGPCGPRCPGSTGRSGSPRAVAATLAAGRGAVVVVPDARDLDRLDAALTALLGAGRHARADRRRRARGALPRVPRRAPRGRCGSWSAPGRPLFAPVARPRPGRDLGRRRRPPRRAAAPAPARPRGAAPARRARTAAAPARRVRAHAPRRSSWSRPAGRGSSSPTREQVRRAPRPLVRTVGDGQLARDAAAASARLPTLAWQAARDALRRRAGAGAGAAARATCRRCLRALPRARPAAGTAPGRWRPASGGTLRLPLVRRGTRRAWHCAECGGARLRARWSAPGAPPRSWAGRSPACRCAPRGATTCWTRCPARPRWWSRTPGAEPVAEGGYGAALLLDAWALLDAARPAGRGGGAAPLARRRGAGRGRRRTAAGRGGRRADAAAGAGAGALGPGRVRGARAGRAGRAGLPAGAGWRRSPGRRRRWPSCSRAADCRRTPRCSGRCRCRSPPPGRPRRRVRRRPASSGSGRCCGCRRARGPRWPPR